MTTDSQIAPSKIQSLHELRNTYKGRRCYILGNGPSLNKTDLSKLKGELTIGLNRIYLKFDEMGFATTFLCSVNQLVLEQFGREICKQSSSLLLNANAGKFPEITSPVYYMTSKPGAGFETDLSNHTWYPGATVTYAAMQLAYHLGCAEVILLGVDHNFGQSGRAHLIEKSQGQDENHFNPNYFGRGILWQYPDLQESEINFATARAAFEINGRAIKDATVDGRLTVFPRITGYERADFEAAHMTTPTPTNIAQPSPKAQGEQKTRIYETVMNNQHRSLIATLSGLAVLAGALMIGAVTFATPQLALLVLGCLLVLLGGALCGISLIGVDWFSEWSRRRRLREGQVLLSVLEILRDSYRT